MTGCSGEDVPPDVSPPVQGVLGRGKIRSAIPHALPPDAPRRRCPSQRKAQGKPPSGCGGPGPHKSRPPSPHLHPGLVHHNNRWEGALVELDPRLPNLLVPIPHRHMAHTLPQKVQYLRRLPETQARLIEHKPKAISQRGTRCFPMIPLALRRCPSFLKLSRGSPLMVVHHRKFAQKENPRFLTGPLRRHLTAVFSSGILR